MYPTKYAVLVKLGDDEPELVNVSETDDPEIVFIHRMGIDGEWMRARVLNEIPVMVGHVLYAAIALANEP